MYQVIKLEKEDWREVISMSEYAFQKELSDEEREEKVKALENHYIIGIKEQEKLLSKLHIIPFSVMLEEQEIKMGGIAGVATWPEYRRKGTVKELILDALTVMKKKNQTISFLHPFLISFYRKFGWELCFYQKRLTYLKEQFQKLGDAPGDVRRLQKDETDAVNAIYNQYRTKHNGLMKRSKEHWTEKIHGMIAMYISEDGVPCGYLVYDIKNKTMRVKEFVYLNREAQRGLWNFICQHDSMLNEAELTVRMEEDLDFLTAEPRVKQEIYPYSMARIVDVEGFLREYPKSRLTAPFDFKVTDQWAPWNQQIFRVDSQQVQIIPEESSDHLIECSISSLTAFFLGARSARFLFEAGMIKGPVSEIKRLDDDFQLKPPFLMDFF
ncbi:enhanced intracellular survival protein Eis [Bacillus inaquosorum]|uniref:GNAT family N-acetyltransferase n=2 Tax=Bacillus inaquosorum TaxID=483913 RepID=UPI0022828D03|nr:GNAT family N-acetyltransferase [Bacillus inaquosorum]MCY7902900.1 GNAT family N-acetyltransferase [Bacillus inaquosorum]MCY8282950.1 GNAT family N-acetyltransferase [Bacillus inaquosorum]MCY9455976.1 GNAT family N-acetyltransferase [Bacillus inaquosorum]